VDLDVHQGNGTALCFDGDDSVFTFSIHEDDIYPLPKERSDRDVEVSAGIDDRAYLATLDEYWPSVLDEAAPDLVVYQAGCDVLEGDPLAHLRMTSEGVVLRDARIIDECVRRGIPIVMVLGGGYSEQAWKVQFESIRRTLQTHDPASPRYETRKPRKLARD